MKATRCNGNQLPRDVRAEIIMLDRATLRDDDPTERET